jgi:SAM-dependent methyltransferase
MFSGSTNPNSLRRHRRLLSLFGLLLVLAAVYVTFFPQPEDEDEEPMTHLERLWCRAVGAELPREPDVVFVPTPQAVVDRMLELAELKTNDVLYDLGCGDGRFVVSAARKYGVRAVGVDIDPMRIVDSLRNVRTNGVGHLVTIQQADIFAFDFHDATVVTLYLLPTLNARLKPKLAKLQPGTRILSYQFPMAGAKPTTVVTISLDGSSTMAHIYKWVVPWEEE